MVAEVCFKARTSDFDFCFKRHTNKRMIIQEVIKRNAVYSFFSLSLLFFHVATRALS